MIIKNQTWIYGVSLKMPESTFEDLMGGAIDQKLSLEAVELLDGSEYSKDTFTTPCNASQAHAEELERVIKTIL